MRTHFSFRGKGYTISLKLTVRTEKIASNILAKQSNRALFQAKLSPKILFNSLILFIVFIFLDIKSNYMNLFFNQRVFIPLQFIFRSCAINFKISTFYQILITCF